jgi:hypothetical protein
MKKTDLGQLQLDGWPLPDDFLLELGRLTALWSSLESSLVTYIGKLLGINDPYDMKPFILLRHSSFPQKLDILASLCDELSSEFPHLSDHRKVISQLKAARQARNRYVHNGIVVDSSKKTAVLAVGTARGTVKTSVVPIDTVDVRSASIKVHEAMRSLQKLVTRKQHPSVTETRSPTANRGKRGGGTRA